MNQGSSNVLRARHPNTGNSADVMKSSSPTNGESSCIIGTSSKQPTLYHSTNDIATPILQNNDDQSSSAPSKEEKPKQLGNRRKKNKTIVACIFTSIMALIIFLYVGDKELLHRLLNDFLIWIEVHPWKGVVAFIVVYSVAVTFMIPGTPLIMGSGFVFSKSFGFVLGCITATSAVWVGATIGSSIAFLFGRYLLRDWVQLKLMTKYPIFEAIDMALTDCGFRIMCLLHLTPIIPFGPISYMCGTTSMSLTIFASSNVAVIPLSILYILISASAGHLMTTIGDVEEEINTDTPNNKTSSMLWTFTVVGGVAFSMLSIGIISHVVRMELDTIFQKQKNSKENTKNREIVNEEQRELSCDFCIVKDDQDESMSLQHHQKQQCSTESNAPLEENSFP